MYKGKFINFILENKGAANFEDANLSNVWWSHTDITLEGIIEAMERLKSIGLPMHIFEEIKKALEAHEKKFEEIHGTNNIKGKGQVENFYKKLFSEKDSACQSEYGKQNRGEYEGVLSGYKSDLAYNNIKQRLKKISFAVSQFFAIC